MMAQGLDRERPGHGRGSIPEVILTHFCANGLSPEKSPHACNRIP